MSRAMLLSTVISVVAFGWALASRPQQPSNRVLDASAENDRNEEPSDLQLLVPMVVVDDEGSPSQGRAGDSRQADSATSEEDDELINNLVQLVSGSGSRLTAPYTTPPRAIGQANFAERYDPCPACLILKALKTMQLQQLQDWEKRSIATQWKNRLGQRGTQQAAQKKERKDQWTQREQQREQRKIQWKQRKNQWTQRQQHREQPLGQREQRGRDGDQLCALCVIEIERVNRRSTPLDVGPPQQLPVPQSSPQSRKYALTL